MLEFCLALLPLRLLYSAARSCNEREVNCRNMKMGKKCTVCCHCWVLFCYLSSCSGIYMLFPKLYQAHPNLSLDRTCRRTSKHPGLGKTLCNSAAGQVVEEEEVERPGQTAKASAVLTVPCLISTRGLSAEWTIFGEQGAWQDIWHKDYGWPPSAGWRGGHFCSPADAQRWLAEPHLGRPIPGQPAGL